MGRATIQHEPERRSEPLMDVFAHPLTWALLVYAIGHAWHIRRHPWMPCGKCEGSGKARALSFDPYGNCGRCKGKGKRLRFAAKILRYDLDTGAKKR
jgi:DnaJ-class molecular chaperone